MRLLNHIFDPNIGTYLQQHYPSSIPDVRETWENIKETVKNSQVESGKKK